MKKKQLFHWAETVVAETMEQLPSEIKSLAEAVPVLLEEEADEDVVEQADDEILLGLFEGPDHGEELQVSGYGPRIFLYVLSIWEVCEQDPSLFRMEIANTYLHELGHYLGWDEEEIAQRGLG